MRVITDCTLTQSDATVIQEPVLLGRDEEYSPYKTYITGMTVEGQDIYSMYPGTVMYSNNGMLVIKSNEALAIVYKTLVQVDVNLGDEVDIGDRIGSVKSQITVEHLSRSQTKWPIHVGSELWYKTDPEVLFKGNPIYARTYNDIWTGDNFVEDVVHTGWGSYEIPQSAYDMLSNNRGK